MTAHNISQKHVVHVLFAVLVLVPIYFMFPPQTGLNPASPCNQASIPTPRPFPPSFNLISYTLVGSEVLCIAVSLVTID
jgi:hypothetical protein